MSNRMAPFVADRGDADLRRPPQKPALPTKPLRVGHRVVQPLPGRLGNAKLVPRDEPALRSCAELRRDEALHLQRAQPGGAFFGERPGGWQRAIADMAQGESTPWSAKSTHTRRINHGNVFMPMR